MTGRDKTDDRGEQGAKYVFSKALSPALIRIRKSIIAIRVKITKKVDIQILSRYNVDTNPRSVRSVSGRGEHTVIQDEKAHGHDIQGNRENPDSAQNAHGSGP